MLNVVVLTRLAMFRLALPRSSFCLFCNDSARFQLRCTDIHRPTKVSSIATPVTGIERHVRGIAGTSPEGGGGGVVLISISQGPPQSQEVKPRVWAFHGNHSRTKGVLKPP